MVDDTVLVEKKNLSSKGSVNVAQPTYPRASDRTIQDSHANDLKLTAKRSTSREIHFR